jgi:hypothetical protein
MKLIKFAIKLVLALLLLFFCLVLVIGVLATMGADRREPGGYCDPSNGYKYDRWSYPPKLMRDQNNNPIRCEGNK